MAMRSFARSSVGLDLTAQLVSAMSDATAEVADGAGVTAACERRRREARGRRARARERWDVIRRRGRAGVQPPTSEELASARPFVALPVSGPGVNRGRRRSDAPAKSVTGRRVAVDAPAASTVDGTSPQAVVAPRGGLAGHSGSGERA